MIGFGLRIDQLAVRSCRPALGMAASAAAENQVLSFASGAVGLSQSVVSPLGTAPLADGESVFLGAWIYWKNTDAAHKPALGLYRAGDTVSAAFVGITRAWHRLSAVTNGQGPTPTVEGWYFVTARFRRSGNRLYADLLRNGVQIASTYSVVDFSVHHWNEIYIGMENDGTNPCGASGLAGLVMGRGDPAAWHRAVFNAGLYADMRTLDPEAHGVEIHGMWAGSRAGDEAACDPAADLPDLGPKGFSAWTAVGAGPIWTEHDPPHLCSGRVATVSAASASETTLTLSAALPGVDWSRPVADMARIALPAVRGWGPIGLRNPRISVSGAELTVVCDADRPICEDEALEMDLLDGFILDDNGSKTQARAGIPVTNRSIAPKPAAVNGISLGRTAVAFTPARPAAFFAGGLGGGVDCSAGPVIVTRTLPEPTMLDGRLVNGRQLNPRRENAQAYDQRGAHWNADRLLSLPMEVSANDCIVNARHNPRPAEAGGGRVTSGGGVHPVMVLEYGVFHFLDHLPAANEICPPPVGFDGAVPRPTAVVDAAAIAAALPARALNKTGDAAAGIAKSIGHFNRLNPAFAQLCYVETVREMGVAGFTEADHYGTDLARVVNPAGWHLIGDYPAQDKAALLTALITHGCAVYNAILRDGSVLGADGGHHQGRLLMLLLYLHHAGRGAEIGTLRETVGTNELTQFFAVDQAHLDRLKPHDGLPGHPYLSKIKEITRITDETGIWCEAMTSDEAGITGKRYLYKGGVLSSLDGAKTARIVEHAADYDGKTRTPFVINANPGFAVGERVYVRTGFEERIGDGQWSIIGPGNVYTNPLPSAPYRHLNQPTGQAAALAAMGLRHPAHEAFFAYVRRANRAGDPEPGAAGVHDFPDVHACNFDRDNWALHADAVYAAPSGL